MEESEICNQFNCTSNEVAYFGDDLFDVGIMKKVKYPFSLKDSPTMVKENSVVILSANKIRFTITDYKNTLIIEYTGILPALFREKQGIVAEGTFVNGVFEAKNLLAKHDENYMPPEVVKTLVK